MGRRRVTNKIYAEAGHGGDFGFEAEALGDAAEELGSIFTIARLGGVEDESAPVMALAGDWDCHDEDFCGGGDVRDDMMDGSGDEVATKRIYGTCIRVSV